MKRIALVLILTLIAGLLLATQAMASPAATANTKPTGLPHQGDQGLPTPTGTITAVAPGNGNGNGNGAGGPPGGLPGPAATAQAGFHGKPTILRGTITQLVPGSSLTLDSGQTVGLTPDTRIRVPGKPSAGGDQLAQGMQVVIMAFTDPSTNTLVARAVLAIPGKPVLEHRVGTVTSFTPNASIIIQATDGNSYTFMLGPNTKILPAGQTIQNGQQVTIIAPRDPGSLGWGAIGIVVHGGQ